MTSTSPMKHTAALDDSDFVLRNDVMRAFTKSSWVQSPPEIGFGTGSRPPLNSVSGGGPGPGAYPIKTTMGKLMESHITSPSQFSLKGRTKFGDPYSRAISKDTANQPGPGQYTLTGKFLGGTNPRKSGFPKSMPPRDKALLAPGPGQYKPLYSMGKQVLSTKTGPVVPSFAKAERPTLIPPGTTDIGPGEYAKANIAACESQVDSRKPTCGSIKFGTGYKKGSNQQQLDMSEPSPGPGSYKLPGGISTIAKGSPFRNSPAATLSGRNKFGSPW